MDEQEKGKIYWHGSHFEALQLDLHEYRDYLTYEDEHQLSKEALRVDILVVKKISAGEIDKDIARIFKGHNLIEFKSEKDNFLIEDFHKILGYGYLYASFNKIPLFDITLTVSLTQYPKAVEEYLKTQGQQIQNVGSGIYYIEDEKIPIQILESKALSDENLFLKSLRSNLTAMEAAKVVQEYRKLKAVEKKNAYLDGLIQANPNAFREAMHVSEESWEIIMSAAEQYGLLAERDRVKITQDRLEIAKGLKNNNVPIKVIVSTTKLTPEEVEAL